MHGLATTLSSSMHLSVQHHLSNVVVAGASPEVEGPPLTHREAQQRPAPADLKQLIPELLDERLAGPLRDEREQVLVRDGRRHREVRLERVRVREGPEEQAMVNLQ